MPIQPLTATLIPDPGGGTLRGVATIPPRDDAGGIAALREWQAHLDAGRLTSAPPPSPGWSAQMARIRETERVLRNPAREHPVMRVFKAISDAESHRLADEERAAELAQLQPFLAALPRARDDGWSARRQFDFIEALADTGSVGRAAEAVGMSRESAYRLRRRADARAFADAWNTAQTIATQRLADAALERAIHGEQVPIVSKGEIVGYRVRHFEQLAMFLLRVRDPHGHGPLSLPSRDDIASAGSAVFDPIPRALRSLPRLLVRLLGGAASAAAESHRTM